MGVARSPPICGLDSRKHQIGRLLFRSPAMRSRCGAGWLPAKTSYVKNQVEAVHLMTPTGRSSQRQLRWVSETEERLIPVRRTVRVDVSRCMVRGSLRPGKERRDLLARPVFRDRMRLAFLQRTTAVTGHERKTVILVAGRLSAPVRWLLGAMRRCSALVGAFVDDGSELSLRIKSIYRTIGGQVIPFDDNGFSR